MFRLIALVSVLAISVVYGSEVQGNVKNNSFIHIDSFIQIRNSSSYYYIEQTKLKNWYAAYHACRLVGADLVSFETLEELKLVGQYIIDSKLSTVRYWTSGIDFAYWGDHVWFSNGVPVLKTHWFADEPSNRYNIEHCDELRYRPTSTPNFALNDLECEKESRYICEKS